MLTDLNHKKDLLTVVIPTYNAGADFGKLLDGLQKQTMKYAQIVAIDSGSTDDTVKIATKPIESEL